LTPGEILAATDAELNTYIGLKRLAPYQKDMFDHRRPEKLKEFKKSLGARGAYDAWGTEATGQSDARVKKRKGKKERQKEKAMAAMDETIKQEQVQEEEGPKSKKRKRKHKKGNEVEVAE
jgi:protein KRI1